MKAWEAHRNKTVNDNDEDGYDCYDNNSNNNKQSHWKGRAFSAQNGFRKQNIKHRAFDPADTPPPPSLLWRNDLLHEMRCSAYRL